VVVWHDPTISKEKCRLKDETADLPDPRNPLRRIMISQQPLATVEAYQCDLNPEPDRFPDQRPLEMPLAGTNYQIVTLDALFAFVDQYAASDLKSAVQRQNAAAVQFNVETKRRASNPENINDGFTGGTAGPFELAILDLIEQFDLQDRVVIQSFDHRSLQTIRAINDEIRLAALTTGGEAKVKVYKGYQFDIWSPNARDLTPALLQEAQALGLLVIPWTVNDPDEMQRWIDRGVDGLISDRPDLLLDR
jgi:glycerophosphoryl diester phosphodiesterase